MDKSENWQYRGMIDREGTHSVRQVFYDEANTLISFSVDPLPAIGLSEEELINDLTMMIEALQQPFLLEGDFVPDDEEINFTFVREDEEKKYH